jgi:hypothetical protein
MKRTWKLFHRSLKEEMIGSCNNPCASCAEKYHCLNKKNALQPTPIVLWGCLAVATAVPLFITLNPKLFARFYAGKGAETMDREDVEECFGDLFAKVGLTKPEKVQKYGLVVSLFF